MENNKRDIVIFTSCAAELKKEQIELWEILDELKKEWKQKKGIAISFNTQPNMLIKYDIFIGVVWTHFSQSTFPTGSATFDDFNQAFQRYSNPIDPVKIVFFIKDYPIPPSKIEGEGLFHLQRFLNPIRDKKNLCVYYYDRDEFSKSVRHYLNRQISVILSGGNIKKDPQKPIRDISHVLYRITNNTDTLEDYLIKLTRLLGLYFNCSTSKAFFLDKETSKLRYVVLYDGKKSVLLRSKEDIGAISLEEEKLINGDVISGPRMIGYPLIFSSLLGGLIVRRSSGQEVFQEYHSQLLSFIAEQSALSAVFYTKSAHA